MDSGLRVYRFFFAFPDLGLGLLGAGLQAYFWRLLGSYV